MTDIQHLTDEELAEKLANARRLYDEAQANREQAERIAEYRAIQLAELAGEEWSRRTGLRKGDQLAGLPEFFDALRIGIGWLASDIDDWARAASSGKLVLFSGDDEFCRVEAHPLGSTGGIPTSLVLKMRAAWVEQKGKEQSA